MAGLSGCHRDHTACRPQARTGAQAWQNLGAAEKWANQSWGNGAALHSEVMVRHLWLAPQLLTQDKAHSPRLCPLSLPGGHMTLGSNPNSALPCCVTSGSLPSLSLLSFLRKMETPEYPPHSAVL